MSFFSWTQARERFGHLPPYPLEPASDGDWWYRLPDGRQACSRRAPRREAELLCRTLKERQGALLLGLGAGHEWDVLVDQGARNLLVVEADLRSVATTLERWSRTKRRPPSDDQGLLLWAPGDVELHRELAESLRDEHGERPLLVRPACVELWRSFAPRAAALVEDLLRQRAVARQVEEMLERNSRLNEPRLKQATCVADLAGSWGDESVVVCGAGPGLERDLQAVAGAAESGMRIVAASTALPVLEVAGLRPDAVVATDPSPLLLADLPREDGGDGFPLAVFPGTCAALVDGWRGPLWLALPEGPGLLSEEWQGLRPGRLRAGCGTVAGPALALAANCSRGPLWLSGVDLAVGHSCYSSGVRRPADLPRPDFAFARRRMAEWVAELRAAGRRVAGLTSQPGWLTNEVNP